MPASFTLTGTGEFYPSGTTVAVYPRATMLADRAPSGSSVASAVAGASSVAFSGLAFETQYAAYALVAGQHRYKTFKTDVAPVSLGLVWQGAWDGALPYVVNDAVTYGGQSYRRKAAGTTAGTPAADAANWELIAAKGSDGISVPGLDLWASQANPAAVTDWGAIINAFITAGVKMFWFRRAPGVGTGVTNYPVTTTIDLSSQSGVSFVAEAGNGGHAGNTVGGDRFVRLVWKNGAGSGSLLKFDSTDAFSAWNMAFGYDNVAYNGVLINAFYGGVNNSGDALFEWCYIGPFGSATNSAAVVVSLQAAVGWKFQFCKIAGGNYVVKGRSTNNATSSNCDDNSFLYCLLNSGTTSIFCNVGNYMVIDGCVFEMGSLAGTRSQAIIDSDHTIQSANSASNFTFSNNRIWDPVDGAHVYFQQRVNNIWDAHFERNFIFPMAGLHWNLNGPGNVTIDNNRIERTFNGGTPIIDAGSSTTAYKTTLAIRGNRLGSINNQLGVITNLAGHQQVEVSNNAPYATEVRTVVTEANGYAQGQGLTITNGVAGIAGFAIRPGNDYSGIIELDTITVAVAAGAKVADFAFKAPPPILYGSNATVRLPIVILSPHVEAGRHSGAAAVAAGFYAQVTTGSYASFALFTANGISSAGNPRIAIAYKVVFA